MTRDGICKHKHMEMLRYRSQESLVSMHFGLLVIQSPTKHTDVPLKSTLTTTTLCVCVVYEQYVVSKLSSLLGNVNQLLNHWRTKRKEKQQSLINEKIPFLLVISKMSHVSVSKQVFTSVPPLEQAVGLSCGYCNLAHWTRCWLCFQYKFLHSSK